MPRKQITIGLAEDMLLDQALIEHHIKAIKNTRIIFRSNNGVDLLQKLNDNTPDILIIDLYMSFMSGWEVLEELYKNNYEGVIVCLSNSIESNLHERLIKLNVTCYAQKLGPNISKSITEAIAGRSYFEKTHKQYPEKKKKIIAEIDGREIEIINKLAEGKTAKIIANELGGLSEKTVDTYIQKLVSRFQCNNRIQLIALAYYYGLIYTHDFLNNLPIPLKK